MDTPGPAATPGTTRQRATGYDVFVSHSSKDKAAADATCHALEARGIRCWIAPRDIRPGATWGESILGAISSVRVMALILSSNANTSPHIQREVERAVNRGVIVIPMRIEDVLPADALKYFLSSSHWLDWPSGHRSKRISNISRTRCRASSARPGSGPYRCRCRYRRAHPPGSATRRSPQ